MHNAAPALSNASPSAPTGFIGPFKGGTRAVASLMDGHIWDAIQFNPLALLFVAVVALGGLHYLLFTTALRRKLVIEDFQNQSLKLIVSTVIIFGAGWAYVLLSRSHMATYGG